VHPIPTADQRRGLQKIAGCDNQNRTLDIIFIHGLGGDSWSTWMADVNLIESFWPYWLFQDFPNLGLWTLGYTTSSTKWKSESMPLGDRGNQILDLSVNEGIGERPTVFITHSMGGIIIKQTLRNALSFNIHRFKKIASNTCGIMFIATPHSGANIASFAKFASILYRTNEDVEELATHSSRLRELHGWFLNTYIEEQEVVCRTYGELFEIKPDIPILNVKMPKGLLVVDATSSEPNIKNERAIFLEEDHLSICKPITKSSPLYKGVCRFIKDCSPINDSSQSSSDAIQSKTPLSLSSLESLLDSQMADRHKNSDDINELFQEIQITRITLDELKFYIKSSLPIFHKANHETDLFRRFACPFEDLSANGLCRLILDVRDNAYWNNGKGKLTPVDLRFALSNLIPQVN